ncbi:glycosyl hydrolase family 30 TIM-barrel domain-containing protein [Ditylenchus destructor]|uniref:Glucosylceramidase n=1 Tax=Ditylenchus destructor TaxID=166010 RepID=A0AAD4RC81_9BILA|nr:glycosyl hydrolase family 30 TIM-barrel domain-containing protein [Ditylenchus destructor]
MESSNKAAEESFENLLADSAKETNNARAAESGQKECMKRSFPHNKTQSSSFVCVCNSNFCDEPAPLEPRVLEDGRTVVYYVTSRDEHRLARQITEFVAPEKLRSTGEEVSDPSTEADIIVDASKTFQTIFGFGGAFTDAAGISMHPLSEKCRQNLLRSYFHAESGIGYTVGRVPIASCDFSTHEYSYCDQEDDFELKTFALAPEDLDFKIPFLHAATNISGGALKLFASPWSAPGWMKTNGRMKDGARLKGEVNGKYYDTYAQYFKKFFEEYHKNGLDFWGLTMQNEPRNETWPWQTMDLDFTMQREFAYAKLSPALKSSDATKDIKIMGCDDNRGVALQAAKELYADEEKAKAIDGIATHWYDHADFASTLGPTHDVRPDKFILASEACNGDRAWEHMPLLGDWDRGIEYAHDILNMLRNWAVGWTDWNLCLDLQGGPNWAGNYVDAPIIVNKTADEFYKQPMFYVMGHFSKFVTRGSVHIDSSFAPSSPLKDTIEHVAFVTPTGQRVMVLTNLAKSNKSIDVIIRDAEAAGKTTKIVLGPQSIVTAIWSPTIVR